MNIDSAQTHTESAKSADERLSEELGMDVAFVEQQVRFRLDLCRMQRGEAGEMGYVFINRDGHPDVAVVFDTPTKAEQALPGHPLLDDLATEDCLEKYVLPTVGHRDLIKREIILP